MSQLHTINQIGLLADCLRVLSTDDALLLLEDGVYCHNDERLKKLTGKVAVYVLTEDARVRGLQLPEPACFKAVDYEGFVELCCHHDKVINWF